MDVIVLDDHQMMGQAIAGVLAEVAGLPVFGVCSSVTEACDLIRQRPPRLLVLDVELASGRYSEPAELLKALNPRGELLFITTLAAGFTPPPHLAPITIGVVDKAKAWDELLRVLQLWWQSRPDHGSELLPGCDQQLQAIARLSPRERQLLAELGNGQPNKQIAARLGLRPATVQSYRKAVAAKLGLSGAELVRLAVLARCLRWQEAGPEPAFRSGCADPAGPPADPPPP